MGKWFVSQDVCRIFNISPRTLQTLRDNGTLPFSQNSHKTLQDYRNKGRMPYIQLGGKILYRESDVEKMLQDGCKPVFRKK